MSQGSKYTTSIIYIIANEWAERFNFNCMGFHPCYTFGNANLQSCSGPRPCVTGFIKERKDKSQMAHELLVCG